MDEEVATMIIEDLKQYIGELEAILDANQKVFLYRKGMISIGKLAELLRIPYEEAFDKYFRGYEK